MASSPHVFWSARQTDDNVDLIDLITTTSKLQISSEIDSLFPYVEWVVGISPALMDNGTFAIGKTIEFIFNKAYKKTFRVFKISAIPSMNTSSIPDNYTITLVSPWYFDQTVGSKIYYGTTSEILEQIAKTFSTLKKPVCIKAPGQQLFRYRTYQTEGAFIDERIRPYFSGESNHTASFIYVNDEQGFFATDEQAIFSSNLQAYAINPDHPHKDVFTQVYQDEKKLDRLFFIRSIGLFNNKNDMLWANSKPSTMYLSSVPGQYKPASTPSVFSTLLEETFLPITASKDVSTSTKIVMDDSSRVYGDVKAQAQNEIKQGLFDSQGLTLIGDMNLDIQVGQAIQVYVEAIRDINDYSMPSVYSQTYVISSLDHLISGSQGQTHVTCSCSAFSYDDARTVLKFFRT